MLDSLKKLTKQLYPSGRVFKMPLGGVLQRLHDALGESETRAYNDAKSTLDSVLPDNGNFSEDDATDWERRLGIPSAGSAVDLAVRKQAIIRKLNHPGTIRPRQSARYIEKQLRAAGFDVHVYENRFDDGGGGWITKTPTEIIGAFAPVAMAGYIQAGMAQHGQQAAIETTKVANSLEEATDKPFDIGSNYRSTFYISATIPWTLSGSPYADVQAVRKNEFRQLILQLKPQHSVAFLFINYV